MGIAQSYHRAVYSVAVTRLETSLDDEAKALALDLGSLAYDARLKLLAGLPAIVLASPERERATALLEAIRGRGHDALLVHASEIVSTPAMVTPRRFRFDADALVATENADARLRWDDLVGIVRAVHRTSLDIRETVETPRLGPARATSTPATRTRIVTKHVEESVAYLFVRDATPWLLNARRLRYHGDEVAPSTIANLELTIGRIIERAPRAAFDDRLVARKLPAPQADLLAYVLVRSWTPSRW